MWIIYLVIALAVSTGAGVFMSRDTNVTISDIQRIEAPKSTARRPTVSRATCAGCTKTTPGCSQAGLATDDHRS